MNNIVCTMPTCQTSAGCVCGRTIYVPPFTPTVADRYWSDEIKALNEKIDRLTAALAEAREVIRRYGDKMRMSFAPPELQRAIDEAMADRALKEKP